MRDAEADKHAAVALLILRFFLGIFLLQWGLEKVILPRSAERIANAFYGVSLPTTASYALGTAEIILSLAFLLGLYRTSVAGWLCWFMP